MTKPVFRRRSLNILIVASIAFTFALSGVAQSFAGCGGYCEARRTLTICHRAITTHGLEAHNRDVEFERCKSNPLIYLARLVQAGPPVGLD